MISNEEVRHIAKLANLEFCSEEIISFSQELSDILKYVDKINEVDTQKIQPISRIIPTENIFVDERIKVSLPIEDVLKNAPSVEGEFFKVPKIIE